MIYALVAAVVAASADLHALNVSDSVFEVTMWAAVGYVFLGLVLTLASRSEPDPPDRARPSDHREGNVMWLRTRTGAGVKRMPSRQMDPDTRRLDPVERAAVESEHQGHRGPHRLRHRQRRPAGLQHPDRGPHPSPGEQRHLVHQTGHIAAPSRVVIDPKLSRALRLTWWRSGTGPALSPPTSPRAASGRAPTADPSPQRTRCAPPTARRTASNLVDLGRRRRAPVSLITEAGNCPNDGGTEGRPG